MWQAPERLEGKSLTKAMDVYAFAMTFYEVSMIYSFLFMFQASTFDKKLNLDFHKRRMPVLRCFKGKLVLPDC
jgi:serine/threonine protein kinase